MIESIFKYCMVVYMENEEEDAVLEYHLPLTSKNHLDKQREKAIQEFQRNFGVLPQIAVSKVVELSKTPEVSLDSCWVMIREGEYSGRILLVDKIRLSGEKTVVELLEPDSGHCFLAEKHQVSPLPFWEWYSKEWRFQDNVHYR